MISVVVPVYNEEESLRELHRELVAELSVLDESFEIIVVDDGSTDATPKVLRELQSESNRLQVVAFVRNFGKSAAYTAGFREAAGETIVTIDADLQDDPAEIPSLLEALREGHDMVVGWKKNRFSNEPHKAFPSKVFNRVVSWLFGLELHDTNSGFRAMRRRVALAIDLRGDLYRFLPQLAQMEGFDIGEVPVHHRPRKHGRSKYGPRRFWTGLLDILTVRFLTRYTERPLHFLGTLALLPLLAGVGLEIYVLIMKFGFGSRFRVHMAALVTGVMLILTAVQFVATGLIGEMLSSQKGASRYVLDESRTTAGDSNTGLLETTDLPEDESFEEAPNRRRESAGETV